MFAEWPRAALFQYGILPAAIFAARVAGVSQGTVRVILLNPLRRLNPRRKGK
jgi:hypothetical protein